jgi:hypothetical protein
LLNPIEITFKLRFEIPDEGLTFNGILYGLKTLSSEIMLMIIKMLFKAIETRLIEQLKANSRYVRNGHQRARTLKTSLGSLNYAFAQVKDNRTNKTLVPLREALKIPRYIRYQNESMEPAIGLAVHLSYNKADEEIKRIQGTGASRWTVRRRLHEFSDSGCQFGGFKKIPYIFLMADGTKVHLQDSGGKDLGQKQMRWALASLGVGEPFDVVGIWVNKSWEYIAKDLKARLNYKNLEILFSDGEPGIESNLLTKGMRHQRCTFHGKKDFPFILYRDGLKKDEQKDLLELMKLIPALAFSNEQIETISENDKDKVTELCEKTKSSFNELLETLDPEKYPTAHAYIKNLSESVSTFFYYWLENKKWIPFTSNIIENHFSQIKNRIKRIGRRWSDSGLIKWLMVVIQKIFTPENWDSLWEQFLKINHPLKPYYMEVSYRWLS